MNQKQNYMTASAIFLYILDIINSILITKILKY